MKFSDSEKEHLKRLLPLLDTARAAAETALTEQWKASEDGGQRDRIWYAIHAIGQFCRDVARAAER